MLGLIFAAPLILLLVLFTLSNPQTVNLALWPTDLLLEAPLSVAVLAASAVFFVLGGIVVGISSLTQRRRARRAESRVRALESEVQALKQRPTTAPVLRTIEG
jgi:lipopolysaccharide assembly protein A